MMTLNNNEKDFQEKLQKDTEMPAIVHERINQAYRLIENNAVLQLSLIHISEPTRRS